MNKSAEFCVDQSEEVVEMGSVAWEFETLRRFSAQAKLDLVITESDLRCVDKRIERLTKGLNESIADAVGGVFGRSYSYRIINSC